MIEKIWKTARVIPEMPQAGEGGVLRGPGGIPDRLGPFSSGATTCVGVSCPGSAHAFSVDILGGGGGIPVLEEVPTPAPRRKNSSQGALARLILGYGMR